MPLNGVGSAEVKHGEIVVWPFSNPVLGLLLWHLETERKIARVSLYCLGQKGSRLQAAFSR